MDRQNMINRIVARKLNTASSNKAFCIVAASQKALCIVATNQKAFCYVAGENR